MSIKVNEQALNELRSILESREITEKTVRLFVAGVGCSGPQFNLSIDEKDENDFSVEVDGFTFLVEKELLDEFGGFSVEFFDQDGQRGIYVEPDIKPQGGCAGCSCGC